MAVDGPDRPVGAVSGTVVLVATSVAAAVWCTTSALVTRAIARDRLGRAAEPAGAPARGRPHRERWRRVPADRAASVALPDAVDLLAIAARAGLPAAAAVATVGERAPPPLGTAFAVVVARAERGERFADALDELARVGGDPGAALRSVLRASADDGADLLVGLERLGADARDARRRLAEENARRIPVRLLAPLVACSLPAFALLSIVPIVVSALGSLDL